jgi:predicted dehydrogenase
MEIDTVLIATRHDTHIERVVAALKAGKKVYLVKPLCLSVAELNEIKSIYGNLIEAGKSPFLMVGANRRFVPQVLEMRQRLSSSGLLLAMTMMVNAGGIRRDH